jgi:plasmid maintenance system antidote protein VapI
MEKRFEKYKGIHPGIVLERELKRRSLRQRPFALSVAEHPQTFNAITKGRRSMGTALALKIEKELGLEEGTLALLQTHHDILKEKEKQQGETPDLSILRQALFWDTDINRIDWHRQYNAVIQRVFERGNEQEKNEITRFYGSSKVQMTLKASRTMPMTLRQKP